MCLDLVTIQSATLHLHPLVVRVLRKRQSESKGGSSSSTIPQDEGGQDLTCDITQ